MFRIILHKIKPLIFSVASFMSDHEWKIKFCLCGVAFLFGVIYLLHTPGEVGNISS